MTKQKHYSELPASPAAALENFTTLLGVNGVLTAPDDTAPYLKEWRDKYQGQAAAILRPACVEQVIGIVEIAKTHKVALVPQGGNTGLVGGQIAFDHQRQFVVNLSRMNRIRALDADGYTITVEAGAVLANVQAAAENVDRLFPLSLGSQGSCQIGGTISSNAGGTSALSYGVMRDLVLGLEVVLPDGSLYQGLNRLKKDNTGYDLKNLFIGAEGTLGIVTAAVLKLFPQPRSQQVAFVAFPDLEAVARFYTRAQSCCGRMLTAFEIIPHIGITFLEKHNTDIHPPVKNIYPWYGLIEISSGQSTDHASTMMMTLVEEGFLSDELSDGTMASSQAQQHQLWHMRHALSECQKPEGGSIKHDISVPVASLPAFLTEASKAAIALVPDCRPVPFGHWGDGNIHFNISQPVGMAREKFLDQWEAMNECIHAIVTAYGGSISAEHGIGVMKRQALAKVKDPVALALMHQIKTMLDPHHLINPGKVL